MAVAKRSSNVAIQSGTSNSITITKPAGTISGDLLLAHIAFTAYGVNTPSGWTKLADIAQQLEGGWFGHDVFYKIAGGAEPASYTFTYQGTWIGGCAIVEAYTGHHPTKAIDRVVYATGGAGSVITRPIATTRQTNEMLVVSALACRLDAGSVGITSLGSSFANKTDASLPYATFGPAHATWMSVGDRQLSALGSTPAGGATLSTPAQGRTSILVTIRQANRAPSAPAIVQPADGQTVALASAHRHSWQFIDPDAGDTISAFALKRNTGGADSWYTVAGGTWGASEVYNPSTVNYLDFPSGKWTNATAYNWAVATKDQDGLAGPYSAYAAINGAAAPAVIILSPTDPLGLSTSPIVHWFYSDAAAQRGFQVKLFLQSDTTVAGFEPTAAQALWDSGLYTNTGAGGINNASKQIQIPDGFIENGQTYVVYVMVHNTSNVYSDWTSRTFTVNLEVPNTPDCLVESQTSPSPRAKITLLGHDNHLTADQSTLDHGSTRGWLGLVNATVGADSSWSAEGDYSLRVEPAAAGDSSAISLGSTNTAGKEGRPCLAGQPYTAMATARCTGGTAKSCRLDIRWYDAAGALLSTSTGGAALVSTSVDTPIVTWGTSPANAVTAAVVCVIQSASGTTNYHNFDKIGFFPGFIATWSRGGYLYGNRLSLSACGAGPDSKEFQTETNCEVTSSNLVPLYEDRMHLLTSSGPGTIMAGPSKVDGTPMTGRDAIPCTPGQQYTMMMQFRSAASPRTCMALGVFWDEHGDGIFSFFIGNSFTSTTGGWQNSIATGTIPDTARYMNVYAMIQGCAAAGEIHYVDGVSITLGNSTLWSWGPGVQTTMVGEWSDDGVEWTPIVGSRDLIPDAEQSATLYDYGIPLNPAVARKYRVRIGAIV